METLLLVLVPLALALLYRRIMRETPAEQRERQTHRIWQKMIGE